MNISEIKALLNGHYNNIEKIILSRQDPITGLLPASTAITAHGDYTDAWVRDNVYSILAVWGLAQSYKKFKPEHNRTHLLSQSVVKLMRGLLTSMMKQSKKVEKFKHTLKPIDSLHAKYSTSTGDAVVGDAEWGHLQLDATSLYLLMLAQMIASGLKIIFTLDEVNFIQNLVHYISRTYCTPDFGIWERGHKINKGNTEVNCSSVGMAKAALEVLNGFNLFGNISSNEAVIHTIPSDIARSRSTLHSLLPRESISKETDAALLSIIGYPAYAVEKSDLVNKTKDKIKEKLEGNYGCKRFLLDGHQTLVEDSNRLYYEPSELKKFEHIECEWPLFFTYFLLDSLMRNDTKEVEYWSKKLENLFVEQDGVALLPELYIVPKDLIEKEKEKPKSQIRIPNENIPLVWAQSLYMLSKMLMDGLLTPNDIDPLCRRYRIGHKKVSYPMVPILSENAEVKKKLLNYGFFSQTLEEVAPLKIMHAQNLAYIHAQLGKNKKLGLTGKPNWIPRSITTARLHILDNEKVLFMPYYFNPKGFYFSYDNKLLVEQFTSSLKYLAKQWDETGQPIMPFLVREDMFEEDSVQIVLKFLRDLKNSQGDFENVKTAPLEQLLSTASIEKINELHGFKFDDLEEEFENFNSNDELKLEYIKATKTHDWFNIRRLAQELELKANRIEDALLEIVIRQKYLAVGRSYSEDSLIKEPIDTITIIDKINKYCGNNYAEAVLTQEVILHLGSIIRSEPKLFKNMITLRTWYFVQLLVSRISRELNLPIGDSFEYLLSQPPHKIYDSLLEILKEYSNEVNMMINDENIHGQGLACVSYEDCKGKFDLPDVEDWFVWRQEIGLLSIVSSTFYSDVWYLLSKCRGLVIGDKYNPNNRIDRSITYDTTDGEKSFELKIDSLLQAIYASEYRQLNIEILESLARLFKSNIDIKVEDDLILDVLIGHSVRNAWNEEHNSDNYEEEKSRAWDYFYKVSPQKTDELFIKTFSKLLEENK